MKSSVLSMLPWAHNQSSNCKPELISQNSMGLARPTIQPDNMYMMKETAGLPKSRANQYNSPHSQQQSKWRQRKITPLLRLNSEGEISSEKNFCDRAACSQFDKINRTLRLSKSFDSSYAVGSSFESPNSNKSIPCPPSFKKSPDFIGSPIHQSYPPPTSPSAIQTNFFCSMVPNLPLYSPSPRVLGSVNIFGNNSQDSNKDTSMQSSDPISLCGSKSFTSSEGVSDSPGLCKNVRKMANSKLKAKNGDDSPFSVDPGSNQSTISQASSVDCSSQNSSQSFTTNDSPSILVIRKKKRKRNKKKKESKQSQDKKTAFRPSSCSSPLRDNSQDSFSPQPKSGVLNVQIVSPIRHTAQTSKQENKQKSSPVDTNPPPPSKLFYSAGDHSCDDDMSDDDLVFEDSSSVVFFENSPPSLSKSEVSSKKGKNKQKDECANLNESGDGQKPSSLHFTLSLTVSEDEDNDSSVDWDMSASPSENDQLFEFEFEFNTGLCLDRIIGHVSTTTDCPETKARKDMLRDLNLKWKKAYDWDELSVNPPSQKMVHFACEEDLTTVHTLEDEDRTGEWHRYALERVRFQKRIEDVGKVLAPVLCEKHREKVANRMV